MFLEKIALNRYCRNDLSKYFCRTYDRYDTAGLARSPHDDTWSSRDEKGFARILYYRHHVLRKMPPKGTREKGAKLVINRNEFEYAYLLEHLFMQTRRFKSIRHERRVERVLRIAGRD